MACGWRSEGAKFWLNVLTQLQNRGVQDILIACVDGLKGFPEAINAVFPQTRIQLCIVHMIRHSLKYVSWKDYKVVTQGLKQVYQAPTEELALQALEAFTQLWGNKYPAIKPHGPTGKILILSLLTLRISAKPSILPMRSSL